MRRTMNHGHTHTPELAQGPGELLWAREMAPLQPSIASNHERQNDGGGGRHIWLSSGSV
jgi:hypothetical protein